MSSTFPQSVALVDQSEDDRPTEQVPDVADVLLLNADAGGDLHGLAGLLQPAGYRVRAAASLAQAPRLVEKIAPIAGLLRLCGGQTPPIEEVERLLEIEPALRLIALVEADGRACAQLAQLIRRDLIYDYHTLPVDPERLFFTLGHINGLVAVERAAPAGRSSALPSTAMVGTSAKMAGVADAIGKMARSGAPVLIRGESGTGKELVARAIHQRSARAGGPFIAVNCAGLPPSLIGSELFGHEKGAFTGAIARKIGRIETARGGTLFLDEVGDLPLELQGHFLRFLQDRTIERIGGTGPIQVDVRVLAATHVDLARAVADKRFREDLFYRLDVLSIELPPLRERGRDIELLARYFLDRFARELGRPLLGFREGALRVLREHAWPGNVRELISSVHRAAVMAEGRWVTAQHLGLKVGCGRRGTARPTLHEARTELERRLVQEALERNDHRVQAAARQLNISRMTLYRLIERYGLGTERLAKAGNRLREDS